MKKKAILFLGVICGFTLSAQEQTQKLTQDQQVQDPESIRTSKSTLVTTKGKTATTIWSEDFAGGIPTGWVNQGHNGDPNTPMATALWEYRGATTIPDLTVGSRGAWSGTQDPITSPTASNGFVIFDSDFLDNNGVQGAAGSGSAPTPHVGELITDVIDLSGYPDVQLTIHSSSRYFAGRNLVAFSTDGGVTYGDTMQFHTGVVVNASTSDDEVSTLNISSAVGNSSNVKVKFIFDGAYNEAGASGQGYYYWMMDDVSIDILPDHVVKFTEAGGAPAHDIIFGGSGVNTKTGHMNINQIRSFEFDANIVNFGVMPQTNVALNVEILRNGTSVTTLSSPAAAILAPTDTLTFATLVTPAYTPTQTGEYTAVYSIVSDSIGTVAGSINALDTVFVVTVDDFTTSADFGVFSNSFGTPQLGDDGSGLASYLTFPNANSGLGNYVELGYVDIRFSTLTVDGGDIIVEVYKEDTATLDLVNGFATAPLVSEQFTLNGASGTLSRFDLRNSSTQAPVLLDPAEAYYVVVWMFSNGGVNLIRIANDQSVAQPGLSTLMFNADDARWYTGFSGGSRTFSSPWIRAITSSGIGIDELANFDVSVYPNPSNGERVSIIIDEGGAYDLELVNTTGELIYKENVVLNGNETHDLNFGDLAKGIYILNVKGESGFNTTKLTIQ